MEIVVRAEVYPTEDKEKVMRAISNLFEVEIFEETKGGRVYLVGIGKGKKTLQRFYTLLRSQGILDSARDVLKASSRGNTLTFELNKQASFVGVVNFSQPILERISKPSPLGSVIVEIRSKEIERLIDWLAPSTAQAG
jgi:hypothetical protein